MEIKLLDAANFIDDIIELNQLAYCQEVWTKQQYLDDVKSPYSFYYGIFDHNNLIGYAHFHMIFENSELINFAIHPLHQKKGLGFFLLKTSLNQLQASNCLLEVRKSNLSAIMVYQKMGFQTIDQRKNYYKQPIEDALIMSWEDNNE